MKIALLGKGKTGGKVLEQFPNATVFDSKNAPSFEKLNGHDVIISFLPGEAFLSYVPLLIESKIPVVTGSTGFTWPVNLNQTLEKNELCWIHATNFSLGMNLVRQMIGVLSKAEALFSDAQFNIHEIHHTKKLDAPSGTALSWKEWAKTNCEITSERTGDVIGTHEITLETETESIFLRHTAKDRGIFAAGALWAADFLVNSNKTRPGLHAFADIILKELA
tara:strand:- start:9156 stop:9818 length:663 start_codon:yes stop_codon:yes gene_type:complete